MKYQKFAAAALAAALAATSLVPVHATESEVETILNSMTLRQKITQMIMPDFRQWKTADAEQQSDLTVLNDEVAKIVDEYDFGGVILFANNVKETEQTLKLTTDLQNSVVTNEAGNGNIPLLLTIDQEGGIVIRLGSGTALPGNMAIGATRSVDAAYQSGDIIGSELNALGINTNFAPVMDVNSNPKNPVIGVRSISSNPELVAELGVAMMQGMQANNIATAAKHFPGHGDTATDSHTGLPQVNKTYEELVASDLIPFQAAVDNGIDMLMTAHITFPNIEKDTVISKNDGQEIYLPATLSDDIITGIVRDQMHYDGIVVTDALGMDAISANFGEAEAVVMAFKAGVDIALMPTVLRSKEDMVKMDAIIEAVEAAVESGELTEERLNTSVRRILTLKEERGILDYSSDTRTFEEKLANANAVVGCKEHHDIEREISAKAVTIVRNKDNLLPLKLEEEDHVLLVGQWPNEPTAMEFAIRRLKSEGVIPESVTYELTNYYYDSPESIKDKVDHSDYMILISEDSGSGLHMGSWHTYIPTDILAHAKEVGVPSIVMSIWNPYDCATFPDADATVAVYGYEGMDPTEEIEMTTAGGPNIPAGMDVILGARPATGKLPVDLPVVENGGFTSEIAFAYGHGLTYQDPVDEITVSLPETKAVDQAFEAKIHLGDLEALSDHDYTVTVKVDTNAVEILDGDYTVENGEVVFAVKAGEVPELVLNLKAGSEGTIAPVLSIVVTDVKGREFSMGENAYVSTTMMIEKDSPVTPVEPTEPDKPTEPTNPSTPNTADTAMVGMYGMMALVCAAFVVLLEKRRACEK